MSVYTESISFPRAPRVAGRAATLALALACLAAAAPESCAADRPVGATARVESRDCAVERRERRLAVLRGTANRRHAIPKRIREYRLVCDGSPVTRWQPAQVPPPLARVARGADAVAEVVLP